VRVIKKIKPFLQWFVPFALLIWSISLQTNGAVVGETKTPIHSTSDTNVEVILGGDNVYLQFGDPSRPSSLRGTVCFYINDLAVAFAHSIAVPDVEYAIGSTVARGLIKDAALVANKNAGVVFAGLSVPSDRSKMPLAGTESVELGADATIYSPYLRPYAVKVRGYTHVRGLQHIVLEAYDKLGEASPGMSGSPIVQDGKIIGFLARVQQNGRIIMAVVAAEVYENIYSNLAR